MAGYVLYNHLAGGGKNEESVKNLKNLYQQELHLVDITGITDYAAFFAGLSPEDHIIIAGGDGTLNNFVNATQNLTISQKIFYYPAGSGNDFAHEMGRTALCEPFEVTEQLKDLPVVEVNGHTRRFVNGVGYGIDGYCCQEGDRLRQMKAQKINYTTIAIKGLLLYFKARNAKVTVDGRTYTYKNVWIAPAMHGRYYGGGMMPTPDQDRNDPDGKLSICVFHCPSRIATLCVFPSIFKGGHVKHKKMAAVHTGREITVEFDRPTPLQIDGETIPDVTCYTARSVK